MIIDISSSVISIHFFLTIRLLSTIVPVLVFIKHFFSFSCLYIDTSLGSGTDLEAGTLNASNLSIASNPLFILSSEVGLSSFLTWLMKSLFKSSKITLFNYFCIESCSFCIAFSL